MRGHEYVIELRKVHKKKPVCIFIHDTPLPDWALDQDEQGTLPNVCVHGDVLEALNLLFVTKCMVSANSPSESRAKALFERLKIFKPSLLVVSHHVTRKSFPGFEPDLWVGIWKDGEDNV